MKEGVIFVLILLLFAMNILGDPSLSDGETPYVLVTIPIIMIAVYLVIVFCIRTGRTVPFF